MQFNLENEDQKFAAGILDAMGRKKTALVAQAIVFLFQHDPKYIDELKTYDFSKTSDLMFRGVVNSGIKIDNKTEPDTPKSNRSFPVSGSKKKEVITEKEDKEVTNEEVFPKSTEETDSNAENENLLENMLDSLESFF